MRRAFTLVWLCPALIEAQGTATRNATAEARPAPSGKPWLASFVDTAAEAGLNLVYQSGNEKSKKYIMEANGSGVGLFDFDNDGWLDIFLVNGSRLDGPAPGTSKLYRNLGASGKFADVTARAGVGRAGWGAGVCAGDYNNDGFTDFYVTYWGLNSLYRGSAAGVFTDDAAKAGVAGPEKEWSSGCTFIDYDRDGHLDLFVTSYQQFDLAKTPAPGKGSNCEWKGMPVFCGPRGLPFGRVTLFHNRGNGTFEDVTEASGVGAAQGFYAFTAVAADLNNDGWPDLYVASDSTPSLLFRNNKNGTFSELATEAGVAYSEHGFEQGGMGVAVGDLNGDGKLELMKTNFAGDHPNLYRNAGGMAFDDGMLAAGLGINPQYVAWGVGFMDLDNDGLLDILQVNGHVYPELDLRPAGGERYRNPRLVYRNLGPRFEDVSTLAGPGIAQLKSSRGAAFGDLDNDGDIDAVVMNMGEAPSLLRNGLKAPGRHWVRLKLVGTRSNRTAIGAVVTVEAGGRKQTLPVLSQSSFLSQNDLRLHFGLGEAAAIDKVTVVWPDGGKQEFAGLAVDRTVMLEEK
ncbi:MAG: CRTAC1 family protein [Bryobacterales bacterium]|nr:CRTAC1 family protein [Bryobacterales bacterium]